MKLTTQLIKYYLKYDKNNPFIYLSILLSFLGISLGVMALIISMGVMNGTQKELTKKLTTMKYPITITSPSGKIDEEVLINLSKKFPDFILSEYYETKAIIQDDDEINAVLLYGVDFKKESKINSIFKEGISFDSKSKFQVVIGVGFSNGFGYFENDKVEIMFPKMDAVGFGSSPIKKRFLVSGVFKSGLSGYDTGIMYTTKEALERILGKTSFDGIHISSKNPFKDIDRLRIFLGDDFYVTGWWEKDTELYSALRTEKLALFLVLMIIVLVASLNIISSLLMMVITKRKDISLLISLGATKKEIKNIFFKLGMTVGIGGTILGLSLGFVGLLILSFVELPESIYGFSKLPVYLPLSDGLLIVFGTLFIVFLSSLYPAKKASETDVLKVLRND